MSFPVGVRVAHADVFEVFGSGPRAQSLGGAATAVADGSGAVYHNPAGLVHTQSAVSFGLYGIYDHTSILLMPRPSGYDPPGYQWRPNIRSDTSESGSHGGIRLGVTTKIGEKIGLGGLILIPFEGLAHMQTYYDDEREQYFGHRLSFARLGQNSRREGMGFGVSYGFRPWLSMGISLLFQPDTQTVNQIFTPNAAEPETVFLNIQTKNGLSEAIVLGLQVDPDWPVRFGIVVQDELGFSMTARNSIQVRGTNEEESISQSFDTMNGYHPPRATMGVASRLSETIELIGEASWIGWSRYVDLHSENAGFHDIWEARTALEWGTQDGSRFRVGAGWRPSPANEQNGRTNFVANDRWTVSTGGGGQFQLRDETLEINLSVQLQGLLENTVHKRAPSGPDFPTCAEGQNELCDEFPDPGPGATEAVRRGAEGLQTGNPGFPGYRHGGYIIHAGVELKWLL